MKSSRQSVILLLCILLFASDTIYSQSADYRPGLFFREDWKESPPEIPINQEHVTNPYLELKLYGPGKDVIKKSNHDKPVDDPFYVWSGLCEGNWLLTLKHKDLIADLSSYARVKWRSKQAGFHRLHLVLKLEDGTWLVSRESDGPSGDWRIKEFIISDLHWYELDINTIHEKNLIVDPDLSKVVEIGFTDLRRGGRSAACSRLDWIEVYANY